MGAQWEVRKTSLGEKERDGQGAGEPASGPGEEGGVSQRPVRSRVALRATVQ